MTDNTQKAPEIKLQAEKLGVRASGIWIGVGFTILPFIFFTILLLNVNSHTWRSLPNSKVITRSAPETSIAWSEVDKNNPPLEYKSERISFIALVTDTPQVDSLWDLFVAPASKVEWNWEYTVKNLTSQKQEISVNYFLVDANQSRLSDGSRATVEAQPQETVTLRGSGFLDLERVDLVVGGDWQISY